MWLNLFVTIDNCQCDNITKFGGKKTPLLDGHKCDNNLAKKI